MLIFQLSIINKQTLRNCMDIDLGDKPTVQVRAETSWLQRNWFRTCTKQLFIFLLYLAYLHELLMHTKTLPPSTATRYANVNGYIRKKLPIRQLSMIPKQKEIYVPSKR